MAKCLKCGAVVSDGQKYCNDCLEKENKESYLDSLLSSVAPESVSSGRSRFASKKTESSKASLLKDEEKKTDSPNTSKASSMGMNLEEDAVNVLQGQEYHPIDRKSVHSAPIFDEAALEHEFASEMEKDIEQYDILSEQDLTDEEFERILQAEASGALSKQGSKESYFKEAPSDETIQKDVISEWEPGGEVISEPEEQNQPEELKEKDELNPSEERKESDGKNQPEERNESEDLKQPSVLNEPDALKEQDETDHRNSSEIDDMSDLDELVELLTSDSLKDMDAADENTANSEKEKEEEPDAPSDDLLELINSIQVSGDDGYSSAAEQEDIPEVHNESYQDIPDDILALGEDFGTEEDLEAGRYPDSIGDVFSDTLSAISSLSDEDQKLLDSIPELDAMESKDRKPSKDKKKKKKANDSETGDAKKVKDRNKKPGLLRRIFGNVKEERTEEQIAQMKEKIIADAESKEQQELAAKQKAAEKKEVKKQLAEQAKKDKKQKQAETAKKKAEQKAEAARLKKDKKEKKKRELQELLDEIDEDEGRINKVGASIIFLLFAGIAGFILIGTKLYTYTVNLETAQKDFNNQHYEDAYQNVFGLDIKDEDQTFYLQVMTVMYTYKQLNSFNNYYSMKMYPQALDSLLKGLQRYDKYSALASVIEIESDMDFVRDEIVKQLKDVFGMSEREAIKLAANSNLEDYTAKVYEIAEKIEP